MKIVVTGVGGFIGSHLIPHLKARGHEPIPLDRSAMANPHDHLLDADAVIHLAGIAHSRGVAAEAYRQVNCELPVRLATAAGECGVARFVFVSTSHAESHPKTSYGASKAEAESQLLALVSPEIVIMRPTPVYGANAKGNFRALLRLAKSPFPLPFGAITARRSMVYVGNLVDALTFAAEQPGVAGRTFTVTDPGPPLTLAEILTVLRAGSGWPRLIFPAPWLPGILRGLGADDLAEKLFSEAVFEPSALSDAGWVAPFTADEALRLTARTAAIRR